MNEDWVETEIGNIAKLYQPKTISSKMLVPDGKYPVYGANGIIGNYDKFNHEEEELLITCRGATCGNVHLTKAFSWINGNAMVVKPLITNSLNIDYLKHFFSIRGITQKAISGSAQPQITRTTLFSIKIPIASLVEQKAIVRKIEELFSSLDSGIADLKKAQEQLVIYRQAVLKKAFEGELTDCKQKNKEIPEGWKREKIRDVCDNIKVGIVIKPTNFYSQSENGVKAFRSANVREFRVNDTNWVYFSKDGNDLNKRTQVYTGDVLLVRSGYPGTSCVVKDKFNGTNAIDILIATPNKEKILPDFLCAFNNSPLGKGLFSKGSQGVAQKHLNVGVYGKLLISYPCVIEQHKILKEIESRLSVCDKVEESITESLEKAKALRQSILKKAFEGELLSAAEIARCKQDKDYEPAGVLLERIKNLKK